MVQLYAFQKIWKIALLKCINFNAIQWILMVSRLYQYFWCSICLELLVTCKKNFFLHLFFANQKRLSEPISKYRTRAIIGRS